MTAPMKTADRIVASVAARSFSGEVNATKTHLRGMRSGAWTALFVYSAIDATGLAAVFLWAVVAWRVSVLLMSPLTERAMAERRTRLALLPVNLRQMLTSSTVLLSGRRSA